MLMMQAVTVLSPDAKSRLDRRSGHAQGRDNGDGKGKMAGGGTPAQ